MGRFDFRTRSGLIYPIIQGEVAIDSLLDIYPNAAVAYSLRKIRVAYSGSAIRVRRSSDNAEQNIGFLSNNTLDTASLLSFCGVGNGFITTWYDQSTNARNATQTTATNQPQIVSSGNLLLVNSKPCFVFNGTNNNRLNISSNFWTYTGDSTVFYTALNTHTSYQSLISYFESGTKSLGIQLTKYPATPTNVATDVYSPGGVATNATQTANTQLLVSMKWQNWSTHKTNGNTRIGVNGVNQAFSAYGSNPDVWANSGTSRIGSFDNSFGWDGKIQEIVIYTTPFTATDITNVELILNQYYGVY